MDDVDLTCTSICKCLQDLEDYGGDKSGEDFVDLGDKTNLLFRALMDHGLFEAGYLHPIRILAEQYKHSEEDVLNGGTIMDCKAYSIASD